MIETLILLIALSGFVLLLIGMARHQSNWFGRMLPTTSTRLARLAGSIALMLAFGAAVVAWGWAYGTILWFGALTPAAACVVAAETWRDRGRSRRTR